ncbi:MAG: hypothetical protein KAQ71_18925, partial [Desulfobulbaceae bacterium]|nr:hypothetical protein [Desulfobulbaceae bacterium]
SIKSATCIRIYSPPSFLLHQTLHVGYPAPMKYLRLTSIFLLIILFSITSAHAWTGKVVGVSDGDTIKVLRDGNR